MVSLKEMLDTRLGKDGPLLRLVEEDPIMLLDCFKGLINFEITKGLYCGNELRGLIGYLGSTLNISKDKILQAFERMYDPAIAKEIKKANPDIFKF